MVVVFLGRGVYLGIWCDGRNIYENCIWCIVVVFVEESVLGDDDWVLYKMLYVVFVIDCVDVCYFVCLYYDICIGVSCVGGR